MAFRACAAWLVLLIVLPFSAPFSTCDAATLFGSAAQTHATQPAGPLAPSSSIDHDVATQVPANSRAASRGRILAPVMKCSSVVIVDTSAPRGHNPARSTRGTAPLLTSLRI